MTTNHGLFALHSLFIHPLKSGEPHRVETLNVFMDGIECDRRLMVADENYRFLTARELPELFSIRCILVENGYVFMAPGMPPIAIGRNGTSDVETVVWHDVLSGRAFGRDINDWLTTLLGRPARLVAMTADTHRPLRMMPGREYGFADTGPVLLTARASLAELNERLDLPITMQQFRPNIVVDTAQPWEEDHWQRIRIGEVEFDVGAACDRCAMITVDPLTRKRSPAAEPLKTLSSYRKVANNQVYFGLYLVPRGTGRIYATDRVEVLEQKDPPRFVNVTPPAARLIRGDLPGRSGIATAQKPFPGSELRCVAVIDEAANVKTFRFVSETPAPFDYLPGQFLNIEIPLPSGPTWRSYTISSSPSRPSDISISVKRIEGGVVSAWLHENCPVGTLLKASGPAGQFHFLARPGRKVLLLGAGSGMTPMISMLRWIVDQHIPTDVVLHQSARTRHDLLFSDELALLSRCASMPVNISSNVTQPAPAADDGHVGRLDGAMLEAICPDLDERVIFCCGPDGFRRDIRALLKARPHPLDSNFLEESFGAAPAPAGPPPTGQPEATVQVTFAGLYRHAAGSTAQTLLEIIRAAGLPIQSGCQAGLCGACKCRVISGDWALAPSNVDPQMSVLPEAEREAGFVLACSCRPAGDMMIELAR